MYTVHPFTWKTATFFCLLFLPSDKFCAVADNTILWTNCFLDKKLLVLSTQTYMPCNDLRMQHYWYKWINSSLLTVNIIDKRFLKEFKHCFKMASHLGSAAWHVCIVFSVGVWGHCAMLAEMNCKYMLSPLVFESTAQCDFLINYLVKICALYMRNDGILFWQRENHRYIKIIDKAGVNRVHVIEVIISKVLLYQSVQW